MVDVNRALTPSEAAEYLHKRNIQPIHATIRDQFAMAALTGLIANTQNGYYDWESYAKYSYELADKMMRVRDKDKETEPKVLSENAVVLMNDRQRDSRFHPYTCPGNHPECENIRELIATKDRWVCQCGRYTQEYKGVW